MKKCQVGIAKFLIILFVFFIGGMESTVYAAPPADENYDDDAGYSNATTQFTVDEMKYTLTGPGPDTLVTNVAPSGWGNWEMEALITLYLSWELIP